MGAFLASSFTWDSGWSWILDLVEKRQSGVNIIVVDVRWHRQQEWSF